MLVHNAEMAEVECGIPRDNIFVCDDGDVIEFYDDGTAQRVGRVHVGGVMYDDAGTEVSEVVLKDRIHMSTEGIFVVVLTVQRGTGRILSSPDIISRGFIYLRDSESMPFVSISVRKPPEFTPAGGLTWKASSMT